MESCKIGFRNVFEEKKLRKTYNYDGPILVKRREMTGIRKTAISQEALVSKFNNVPFQNPLGMGKKMA